MEVKMVVRILVTDGQTKDTSNCRVTFACEKIQGVPKRGGLRISALYVFYCSMCAFRGLLNILHFWEFFHQNQILPSHIKGNSLFTQF